MHIKNVHIDKKIKPGRPGNVRGVRYNGTGTRTVHAQGTIK